jgi:glucose/arabinose dehydrogenase
MIEMNRKAGVIAGITVAVATIGLVEMKLAAKFGRQEIARSIPEANRPSVRFPRPEAQETNVPPSAFIAADVNLPNEGHGIDPASLKSDSVKIYRTRDRHLVDARVNTSGAGDAIVLQPVDLLEPNTDYTFEVNGAKDTSGAEFQPYAMHFTTGAAMKVEEFPAAFEKVTLQSTRDVFTGLTIGPDHKLYACTFDGKIVRFTISGDGTVTDPQKITTVQAANKGPRLITGIVFDPSATADNLILWVSHGQMAIDAGRIEGADDWTGKMSVVSGPELQTYRDVLVNLPRGFKDHMNFQPEFGPDGALYFCQGANSSTGAPDKKWNFRPERLLTASVLRLDPKLVGSSPIDVKTEDGGSYNPAKPGAALTLYATGVRSGFDVLWHSNGNLYVALNGAAAGGNVPGTPNGAKEFAPQINNITETTDDLLLRIVKGGYYGHPNPRRGQYVLMGGNPTDRVDPQEITEYPVGTKPEANWVPPVYDFGKSISPNGMIEYKGDFFGGALRGRIIVTRFSGYDDLFALTPGKDGVIVETLGAIEGFKDFTDPLDLVEDDHTGCIYVAEYGGQKLSLLRPIPNGVSKKVYRQVIAQ